MTAVTFYVLKESAPEKIYHFVCQTVQKYYDNDKVILLLTNHDQETQLLDGLLWQFDPVSFIPHVRGLSEQTGQVRVFIHHELPENKNQFTVCLNLQAVFPGELPVHSDMIEMVYGDEQRQELLRNKYRQYQQLGHKIVTEKIQL